VDNPAGTGPIGSRRTATGDKERVVRLPEYESTGCCYDLMRGSRLGPGVVARQRGS
jgi:hypothetical protein